MDQNVYDAYCGFLVPYTIRRLVDTIYVKGCNGAAYQYVMCHNKYFVSRYSLSWWRKLCNRIRR